MRNDHQEVRRHGRRAVTTLLAAAVMTLSPFIPAVTASAATATVAQDTFDRSVTGGFGSATLGGAYSVDGDASLLSTSAGQGVITGLPGGATIMATLRGVVKDDTAVRMSATIPTLNAFYFGAETRKQADGRTYRGRLQVKVDGTAWLSISRATASSETVLGKVAYPGTLAAGQKIWLATETTGTAPVQLKVKVWADGAAEPDWQFTASDTTTDQITAAGSTGFWAYTSAYASPTTFRVDDFTATDLDAPAPIAPVTAPNDATTGVRSGTALTRYTGPLTITTDGTVIDSKDIYGDLKVQARNVTIRNSYLHCGTGNPTSNTGCIDANSGNVYNLLVENNTIKPDSPSYYRDGIVGHEFTARGNNISGSNDGIGIFNKPGGSLNANVTVTGNYIHDLKHFNTDPAHSDGTHNDAIQIQGGTNIAIRGNSIVASASGADGTWTYNGHANAAIMITPNVSALNNLVIENNWINKGQASVGITTGKFATVALTLQSNAFGRDQYAYNGTSRYQVRIYNKAATTVTGLTTNTFQDTGARLADGRDLGVRYG